MTIKARIESTCPNCQNRIKVDDSVQWTRGSKAYHTVCPPVVMKTPTVAAAAGSVDLTALVAFLTAAKAHLKFPKVRFLAPDGKSELRLSMTGPLSKYQGAVNIKIGYDYTGRINTDGSVVGARVTPELVATLTKVASNPAAAAKAYGALCGRCSFCNLPLTDEGSVEVGYGPICASHYGLPHSAKGTKAVRVVGTVPAAPVLVQGVALVDAPSEPLSYGKSAEFLAGLDAK
jgi:hypothetical protein